MSSSHISEDFNSGMDLGKAEFTTNSVRNEIMWDMFKNVVEESKLSLAMSAHLPRPDEPTCQAS